MQVLEKILKEIDAHAIEFETFGISDDYISVGWVKEIIRNHMNDGWIPVEERLPEDDGIYIATMDGEIASQKIPFTGLAEFEDGEWVDGDDVIIAWRSLPEAYLPERNR